MTTEGKLEEMPRGWDPEHPDYVHCDCGQADGHESCEWWGPANDTVVVEYMPEHLRASHRTAGNSGSYPHNGAVRIRCEQSCADRLAHVWEDGEQTDELDPWVSVLSAAQRRSTSTS